MKEDINWKVWKERIDMNCTFVNKTLPFTIFESNLESEGLHCMIHKVLFMRLVSDKVSIGL